MKRLLALLLITLALLVVAGLLLVDNAIESAIEREGSRALGAPLDIGSARLRLFPTALTLRDIAAANPHAPQRNMVMAESLHAEIALGQLFERRLVIDRAVLTGLRFNQPRDQAGTVVDTVPVAAPAAATAQPTLALPDADQLAREAANRLRGELQQIEQALRQINTSWQARLQQPTSSDAAQLRDDWNRVSQLVGRARALPDAELQRLLREANADRGAIEQPLQLLLADALAPLLTQLAALGQGQSHGAHSDDWPMLARHVDVDGELTLGDSRLPFTGQLGNVTPQPSHWQLPLTIALSGASEFNLGGSFDHLRNGSLQLALERFPVTGLALADQPQLTVTLARAQLSARGLLTLRGDEIDLELGCQLHDAVLEATATDAAAQRVAELLRGVDRIDLQLRLRGRADAPQLTVRSSLDQPLAAAFADAARQQAADFAPRLSDALQRELAPQLDAIQQQTAVFNDVQARLRQQREPTP